jgi:hypothetical protein
MLRNVLTDKNFWNHDITDCAFPIKRKHMNPIYHLYDPKASDRESIVNSVKAGLLTCNSFRHPSRFWQWIYKDRNLRCYLQLRDSS